MKPPIYNAGWSDEVKVVYKHDMEEIWNPRLAPHLWNQYHNLLDIYHELAGDQPKDILDIGCAQATLALQLAEKGHRVTAVDIRQPFLDYARTRYTHGDITFVCGDALQVNLNGLFDVVFANQILEHLVYPVEFVSKLKERLKPGGRLVMTTPNWDYIKITLPSFKELGDPKQWEHLQFTADGDGHFFAYRSEELAEIVVSAGLTCRRLDWFETPWISGHMKVRYLHPFVSAGLMRFLDRILQGIPQIGKRFCHQLIMEAVRD